MLLKNMTRENKQNTISPQAVRQNISVLLFDNLNIFDL